MVQPTDAVGDGELLLRSIPNLEHHWREQKPTSLAFADRKLRPSVFRVALLESPDDAKRQPDAGLAQLRADAVRSIKLPSDQGEIAIDVEPAPDAEQGKAGAAHALIKAKGELSKRQFDKLRNALVRICTVIELPRRPSDPAPEAITE